VTDRQTEALNRLNQGIQESRQEVQQRTMSLAQEYFGDSGEVLKQQVSENRATLENLPDQIPGGRDEAFQTLFQELMENYSAIEEAINEAQKNVANLDTEQIRRQGEVEATDAARREARELSVDLTQVKGTGAEGRIIVSDVVEAAEAMGDGAAGEAAQGAAQQVQDTAGQAVGQAQQAAGQATDQVGQVAGQAQDTVGGATQQAQDTAGQVTDQAGQAVQGVQDTVGGLTGGGQQQGGGLGGALGGVTDQVGQAAQGVQDTAGQAAQQGQQAVGQAAQQGQQAVGQAAQQAGGGQQQPDATDAARQKAQELGVDLSQVQGSGANGRITVRDVQQAANQ
jgi:pyruvate/2-oxoglutarate dehydrogenase complex dihydrolipoamide acyltransferase (E2) component